MNFGRLSVALLLTGVILCVSAALSIRSVQIPIESEFGLSSGLPSYFWVGFFAVLVGAVLFGESYGGKYRLLALMVVALIMWCAPILANTMPLHNDSWGDVSNAQWVVDNAHVQSGNLQLYYLQYPGVFLFGAIWIMIGISPFSLVIFYPVVNTVLFTLGFYVLSRRLLRNERLAFFASMICICGNIAMFYNHYAPSGTAEALLPLVLYAVLGVSQNRTSPSNWMVFLILTFFSVILHPAIPLILLLLVFGLFLFERFKANTSRVVVLVAVLYSSWLVFVGNWGMTNLGVFLNGFWKTLVNFERSTPASQLVTRQSFFPTLGFMKIAIFAFFVIGAFAVICVPMRKKPRMRHVDKSSVFFVLTFFAFILSSSASVIYGRVLTWVIPFSVLVIISYVARFNVNVKVATALFLTVLVVIAPLTFLLFYSSEREWTTTNSEYQGMSFVAGNIRGQDKILMDSSTQQLLEYFARYRIEYTSLPMQANESAKLSLDRLNVSTVVIFRIASFLWQYYEVEGTLNNSYSMALNNCTHDPSFDLVYSDGGVTMFHSNVNPPS